MTTHEIPQTAVLTGGQDAAARGTASIAPERSAAVQDTGGTAADPWAPWARPQLEHAARLAEDTPSSVSVASVLYRDWFNPVVDPSPTPRRAPLAGVYRSAHAGSATTTDDDGLLVLGRHDVVGSDGWWRTWGTNWTPPRTRPHSVRLFFSPRREHLADFVHTMTTALASSPVSWSLGCATDPRRIRRAAAATLDIASSDAVPDGLIDELAPLLHPVVPPLCLPLTEHVALASYPANGMSFGEHRCHLVALALRHPSSAGRELRAIAAVFAAHGVDPAHPHR